MNNTSRILLEKTNNLFDLLSKLILLLIVICLFVPFSPKMPALGLDPSWELGLNQAVAQNLAFGKEIIFTLGPYSSIYSKAYHPATDLMMIFGSLYLAIFYWISLVILMKKIRWYSILAFCMPLFGMIYARDSLFFSYPLLVGLISFKNSEQPTSTIQHTLFTALLFAPFGLFIFIKGSMLILCLPILILCFALFIANNQKIPALVYLIAPIAAAILFWHITGQSIISLPAYLIQSLSIASGFTEAMSSSGNSKEIIFYLFTSLLIFIAISRKKQISGTAKFFLLSIFFVFLFVSFKTGFTRHFGHAFIPGTSILFATLFLLFILNSRLIYILIFSSLSCWYYINSHYTKISILDNFASTYSTAWHGLKSRLIDPSWAEKNFKFAMNVIQEQAALPRLPGTSDTYSYNQSSLIASKNTWSPRPIFQSYSVFTPALAKDNKKHLQGRDAPDNIFLKIEPIDNRLPSLEDGASWPLLLANYQPTQLTRDFLILQKKKRIHKKLKPLLITREQHILGEWVHLPKHKYPLFATIEIKPTLWGQLALIFFKPTQLQITCILKNGSKKRYRLIANMARSDFLFSPLIENTEEFVSLYKKNELHEKKVTSFVITADKSIIRQWNDIYYIDLKQIPKIIHVF